MIRAAVACLLILGATIVYGSLVEPRLLLDVREETATVPGLPDAWYGGRIALISDLQVGMWGQNTGMMRRVVRRIVADRPDLVLIAGDFIHGRDPRAEAAQAVAIVAPLAQAGLPVFAVLGNHDWAVAQPDARVDEEAGQVLERGLEEVGIRVLSNEARPVRRGSDAAGSDAPLWIAGIASHWADKDDPIGTVSGVPAGAARVVFMHHADSFEGLPAGEAPLALAAHTHGGQFRLPFLPDWSWMTFVGEDKVHVDGWIEEYGARGNRLYVTRGIGLSTIPMRIRARPELTYFTLQPASP